MTRRSSRSTPAATDSEMVEVSPAPERASSEVPVAVEAVDTELASVPVNGPGDQLSDDELLSALTALVYASPEPISMRRLLEILEQPARARLAVALDRLREGLTASGLPLELREIAGGFQILTKPEMGEVVQRLFKARRAERISSAALETLAVIAYRQPVSKAEIEAIRGVQAGPILRTLIERGLARVTGRADVPGHPLQYGTTREFLERFGLGTLADLPRDAELTKD
jgi:segregation and condensation protein B